MATFLLSLVVVSAALAVFVRWLEPRFAFFPTPGETTTPTEFGVAFEPATIETVDGQRLRVWHLHAESPRALVVYFHGNGGNLSVWAPILSGVARYGYELVAFDYRGYGVSTGRPSESGLYRDADAVVQHAALSRRPALPLVYWGRSLGSAMAAYASTRQRPDGLILESAFPDARSIIRSSPLLALLALFSTYRFPTAEHANAGRVPVLVMHGTGDSVIPFELGRALYDRLNGAKTFVEISGGDHNDTRPPDERAYWRAVDDFVSRLDIKTPSPGR
jgi:fermentation-respiration switch protein FrsA (DUF1100 family)